MSDEVIRVGPTVTPLMSKREGNLDVCREERCEATGDGDHSEQASEESNPISGFRPLETVRK